jgi:hypothetical protein
MRPVFNLEPKYRVTMLTREDWTNGTGAPPAVKGLVLFTEGSKMREGTGTVNCVMAGCRKKAQVFLGQVCDSFPGRDICDLGLCTRNSDSE